MKNIWFLVFFAPLVLLSAEQEMFEVVLGKAGVCLKWSTTQGQSNGCFILERSKNGKDFEAVLSVQVSGENQNSPEYLETDFEPFAGTSYYRLRSVDRDGKESLNLVRSIQFSEKQNEAYTMQNSGSSETGLEPVLCTGEEALVVLLDASGMEIWSRVMLCENEETKKGLALQNDLPSGEYVVAACSRQKYYGVRLSMK